MTSQLTKRSFILLHNFEQSGSHTATSWTRQSGITLHPRCALSSPFPANPICSERSSDGIIPSAARCYRRL